MGGVNLTLQAAAALDRRGITAWTENQDVVVLVDYRREKIRIKYRRFSAKRYASHGTEWEWADSDGEPHYHPLSDYEGLAAVFEKFLRERPEFAGTRVLRRMDHMGWTYEEEMREALEEARARIAKDPEKVAELTRIGLWPPQDRASARPRGHPAPAGKPGAKP